MNVILFTWLLPWCRLLFWRRELGVLGLFRARFHWKIKYQNNFEFKKEKAFSRMLLHFAIGYVRMSFWTNNENTIWRQMIPRLNKLLIFLYLHIEIAVLQHLDAISKAFSWKCLKMSIYKLYISKPTTFLRAHSDHFLQHRISILGFSRFFFYIFADFNCLYLENKTLYKRSLQQIFRPRWNRGGG